MQIEPFTRCGKKTFFCMVQALKLMQAFIVDSENLRGHPVPVPLVQLPLIGHMCFHGESGSLAFCDIFVRDTRSGPQRIHAFVKSEQVIRHIHMAI